MSEKTPKCIDCGSSPDFVVRLASGRWKCVDCRTEWGENWDWNDDPRTKGLQTNLVRLTSERDEAVRVAGELRAKAADLRKHLGFVLAMTRYEDHSNGVVYQGMDEGEVISSRIIADAEVRALLAPLTASTGGSSEPQKEIRE